jgi:hypothetical protein
MRKPCMDDGGAMRDNPVLGMPITPPAGVPKVGMEGVAIVLASRDEEGPNEVNEIRRVTWYWSHEMSRT